MALCQREWEGEGESEVQRGRKRKGSEEKAEQRGGNSPSWGEEEVGSGQACRRAHWAAVLAAEGTGALGSSPGPKGGDGHCWFSQGEELLGGKQVL